MFTSKELKNFMNLREANPEYVEIECGCTIRRLGDALGNLRVYVDGRIKINCCCISNCPKVNLSPVQFARHLGKSTSLELWKKDLWVLNNKGKKIRLKDTCLLRYHVQTFQRPPDFVHRDEFIRCTKCKMERRFLRRTKEQSRIYHRASLHKDWQCSDALELDMKCDDIEERTCRKSIRGCPRRSDCEGCEKCSCVGCHTCRFEDCNCQICVDYVTNEWRAKND